MLSAVNATIDTSMATLMTFVSVISFIYLTNQPIIPTYTVFSIGFYMRLCNTMGFNFTRALTSVVNARVSIKRINEFLLKEELERSASVPLDPSNPLCIEIKDFNYHWNKVE